MMVVHGIAMAVLFTKLNKIFNPNRIAAKIREQTRAKRIIGAKKSRQAWT